MVRESKSAIAYLRTSSAASIGQDKDSARRQRVAIAAFAKREGYKLVGEFNDEAVSGVDAIETRPGFAALLDQIEGNGVRTVIVEDASRFARHVLTQELGVVALKERGVQVFTAGGDELTATDDPSKVMVRQMMAAFAQFEKGAWSRNWRRHADASAKPPASAKAARVTASFGLRLSRWRRGCDARQRRVV